jgi:hypothetical protein
VWSYPEYVPGQRRVIRTDIAVLYVGDEAEKQALLLSEPEVFFTTSAYDWSPLVMVRLEAIDITRLRELVTDAWHMRAPAELKVEYPLVMRRRRQVSCGRWWDCEPSPTSRLPPAAPQQSAEHDHLAARTASSIQTPLIQLTGRPYGGP